MIEVLHLSIVLQYFQYLNNIYEVGAKSLRQSLNINTSDIDPLLFYSNRQHFCLF